MQIGAQKIKQNINLEQGSKIEMIRKVLLLCAVLYFAGLVGLAFFIQNASPGPISQEIHGIGIGSYTSGDGIVYLSGRRLQCFQLDDQQLFAATCRVEIAGKPLEIHARRNAPTHPNQLGGICEAFYDGKQWPCRLGSRHVQVPWFAYIDEPLGLNKIQLDALRREYFFENLPEQAFFGGIGVVSIITAVIILLVTGVWLWPRVHNRFYFALIATMIGIASLAGTCFFAILLTNGFWD